jgi:tetratricopeptide (TPR) repeat protein
MKRVRMMGVVIIGVALALAFARPMEASPQVPPTSEMATDLEAAAAELHDRPGRWADAARLYVVAADLRQQEDPEARKDLFKAATLYYAVGHRAEAVAALESAGARALAGGDVREARRMFDRAAWVARDAGLTAQERRLTDRAARMADAAPRGVADLPTRS